MEDLVFGDGSLLSQQFPILGKDLEIPFLSLKDTGGAGWSLFPLFFGPLQRFAKLCNLVCSIYSVHMGSDNELGLELRIFGSFCNVARIINAPSYGLKSSCLCHQNSSRCIFSSFVSTNQRKLSNPITIF